MRKIVFLTLLICLATATASTAETDRDAILSISFGHKEITYSLHDLQALPVTQFETETIWTDGIQSFEGVLMKDLLDSLNIEKDQIKAIAIDDYAANIPMGDAVVGGPIIAYHHNGEVMSRRNKGPLWIVYPYDSNRNYQMETIYSRSIWQLDRLVLE